MNEPECRPELVIGLVGPIGCDMDEVSKALVNALQSMKYTAYPISLSDEVSEWEEISSSSQNIKLTLMEKIKKGNKLRKYHKNNAIFAIMAIKKLLNCELKN